MPLLKDRERSHQYTVLRRCADSWRSGMAKKLLCPSRSNCRASLWPQQGMLVGAPDVWTAQERRAIRNVRRKMGLARRSGCRQIAAPRARLAQQQQGAPVRCRQHPRDHRPGHGHAQDFWSGLDVVHGLPWRVRFDTGRCRHRQGTSLGRTAGDFYAADGSRWTCTPTAAADPVPLQPAPR